MSELDLLARSGDFVCFHSNDDYEAYFKHLNRVFAFLAVWYRKLVEGGNPEAKIIEGFLGKFLSTVRLLRLKYLHTKGQKLNLDLHDSGFPHWIGIEDLQMDLQRKSFPKNLPNRRVILEMMLEEMLQRGQNPVALLPQMAEIQFNEELDADKLIFTFTPGDYEVFKNGSEETGFINCLFSWLCYDKTLNRPYIYIMFFDFKGTEEEFEQEFSFGDFLPAIGRLGNRKAPLAALASDIDAQLPLVFPRMLRRFGLGPIICPKFSVRKDYEELFDWLSDFGQPEDFALLLEAGSVHSKGETQEKWSWLSFNSKKIRQIFAISEDELASENLANEIKQVIMLPHQVLQQVSSLPDFIRKFGSYNKIAYNSHGGIYVV